MGEYKRLKVFFNFIFSVLSVISIGVTTYVVWETPYIAVALVMGILLIALNIALWSD